MTFNLSKYRVAQRRGRYPSEILPEESERGFLSYMNPYKLHESPGDGQGQKLTTPGSQGSPGVAPDAGVGMGGSNERKGYPSGYSQYEDKDIVFDDIPSDSDPDDPFSQNENMSEYGQGQGTDYGQALHDDIGLSQDSPLGISETVSRDLEGGDRDRKTDISNMQGVRDSKLRSRLRNPYNHRLSQKGPMEFVRDAQKKIY